MIHLAKQYIIIGTVWAASHRVPFAAWLLARMENSSFGQGGSI